jgi:hypothetical protein
MVQLGISRTQLSISRYEVGVRIPDAGVLTAWDYTASEGCIGIINANKYNIKTSGINSGYSSNTSLALKKHA